MKLSEYILLSQDERMAHLDASAPCILVERNRWTRKRFELLAQFGIVNDIDSWRGTVCRCHTCKNDVGTDNTQICINPCHWYWGSPGENSWDRPLDKRQAGGHAMKGKKYKPQTEEHRRNLSKVRIEYHQRMKKEGYPKWQCEVTGYVSTSTGLTHYQNFAASTLNYVNAFHETPTFAGPHVAPS